jgi:hypothetical protein
VVVRRVVVVVGGGGVSHTQWHDGSGGGNKNRFSGSLYEYPSGLASLTTENKKVK